VVDLPGELPGDPEAGAGPVPRRKVSGRRIVEARSPVDDLAHEPAPGAAGSDLPDPAAVPDRVVRDLGDGQEHVERPRGDHLPGCQLRREPGADILDALAEGDRSQVLERRGLRRDPAEQALGLLVQAARAPRAALDDLPPLSWNLALELAPIRVNMIAAGFVDTPLSAAILGDGLEAALAVHLMVNTAVTGATFDIDGGQQLVDA
jgi:hypothetical protein